MKANTLPRAVWMQCSGFGRKEGVIMAVKKDAFMSWTIKCAGGERVLGKTS